MTMRSPYPGLRPFQQDEAALFFGRDVQVEEMLARLEDHRFLVVVGTSGCGKSSLVRAGLMPALEQGFLSDAYPNWRMAVMRPGSAPFDHLTAALLDEAALGSERRSTSQAAALLQATLRRGPLGLVEAVAESHLPADTNLLLVVDQFEEIFRYRQQTPNVHDADAFVSLLLASAQARQSAVPIYVVLTMRSDFLGDCSLFTGLPEAINDSQFLTPRLTRDQYRASMVEPALVAGGQLEEVLVNQLLNDLRGDPDQLPVLQHALMRMWTQVPEDTPARVLTLEDYRAVGGLADALSGHCDEILQALTPAQQRIAEVMFRALCERSAEQRDTRCPVQLGGVAAIAGVEIEAVMPVVGAFRDAGRNFLMPSSPSPLAADTTLDISHESLIRQWYTLNIWVEAEAESARQYQRLEDAARRRQQAGAELWHGVDLEQARVWQAQEHPTAAWAARYGNAYPLAMQFLQESAAAEEAHQRELEQARALTEAQRMRAEEQAARAAEQASTARRLKVVAAVIGVLLMLAASVAIYAYRQQIRAAEAQQRAEEARLQAEGKEREAVAAATEARRQEHIARVRLASYLAAEAKASLETQPTLSILLNIEALKLTMLPAAEETLRKGITTVASIALVGHTDVVRGVAFSPDGRMLATASDDRTVRLWSLDQPTAEPRVLQGHTKAVWGVAFSPDGRMLATASHDQTVRLWTIAIDTLVQKACLGASSNFSYAEWQRFLGDEPYRKTCPNRPLHPSFLESIQAQIEEGNVEDAVAKLSAALQGRSAADMALQIEARRLAAPGLLARGKKLAKSGEVEGAISTFKQALAWDPTLTLEPETEARRLAALALVNKGQELATQGAIREALAAFTTAQESDPHLQIHAWAWNSLCWFGSLGGFATDVLAACEHAVALAPDEGGIRNSRGVARALTGDYPGAIEDFQLFLEWGAQNNEPEERMQQRRDWIRMLQAQQNPFNAEFLQRLREQFSRSR